MHVGRGWGWIRVALRTGGASTPSRLRGTPLARGGPVIPKGSETHEENTRWSGGGDAGRCGLVLACNGSRGGNGVSLERVARAREALRGASAASYCPYGPRGAGGQKHTHLRAK